MVHTKLTSVQIGGLLMVFVGFLVFSGTTAFGSPVTQGICIYPCASTITTTHVSTTITYPSTTVTTTMVTVPSSTVSATVVYTTQTSTATIYSTTTSTGPTTTQVSTTSVSVAGYFTLFGQTINKPGQTVYVSSADLQFTGYITSGQSEVTGMEVCVQGVSCVQLSLSSGNQYGPGTITLPGYGAYNLLGYIQTPLGNTIVMSIVGNLSTTSPPPSPGSSSFGEMQLVGVALMAAGGYLFVKKKI